VGKLKTAENIIEKIINFRKKGYSISEISSNTGKSKSVVSRYIQNVKVLPEYISVLKRKQGGSKVRSDDLWLKSKISASKIIKNLEPRDKIILLIGIYWGEGTKSELNIINSDPILLRAFIEFIKEFDVIKNRIKASIRIYSDISADKAIDYWSNILNLSRDQFFKVELIEGKKKGKLEFGMCRLRVEKSSKEFKLLMSLINNVKDQIMLL
jgi:hypothetical protein